MVGMGYSPTPQMGVNQIGTTVSLGGLVANCLDRSPNGGSAHEVRWLPTAADEVFTSVSSSTPIVTGTGTLFSALNNVDATYVSTTTAALNGWYEFTAVYEWIPALFSSLTVAPKPPIPFTSQQYQSTIKDIGAFLLHGIRTGGEAAGRGVLRGAMQIAAQTIGSYTSSRRYADGMPFLLT